MASKGFLGICSCCGNRITSVKYNLNGKTLCYSCYYKAGQQTESLEQQLQPLYDYIKEIFGLADLPAVVVSQIKAEINGGKKISGIMATLKYHYTIMGAHVGSVEYIKYIIRDQYENAKAYYEQMKKLKQQNAQVDLNVPPVVVKVTPESLKKEKPKFGYNIEDL